MTPYTIIGIMLLWAASIAGASAWFYGAGQDSKIAEQSKIEAARDETRAIAASAAASAIASIEVKHVTIRQQLEREVRTREVFRECRSGPDVQRMLNDSPGIAKPATGPTGDGKLPATGTVGR